MTTAHRSLLVVTALALASPLLSQELPRRLGGANGPPTAAAAPNRAVSRLADGTVDLSGVWTDGGAAPLEGLLKPGELKANMLPWALTLYESRDESQDPYNNCMP
ncbi:MAG: hypothetical protein EXQ48_04790, partial [Acidobacteria bacterium]|nr:hypothetical protein [Acidobacteriota bacterium]